MALYNSRTPFRRMDNIQRRTAEHIEHMPSALCPCSSSGDPSRANPNHRACGGTGHIILREKLSYLLANVSKYTAKMQLVEGGINLPGDLVVSPLAHDKVLFNQWDVIRIPDWEDGEPYEGQLIERPEGMAPVISVLAYEPNTVEYVFSVNVYTNAVTYYTEGTDFSISGFNFTWLTNTPPPGTQVSVRYRPNMEYVIVEPPQIRLERGSSVGQYAIARKRHLIEPGYQSIEVP